MKLTLYEGLPVQETEIDIRCRSVDGRLSHLIDHIRQYSFTLEGKIGERSHYLPLEEICYIDSADGRTFLYSGNQVYESRETLAGLESRLAGTPFTRISKNCILNTSWLKSVSPLWNHRLEALLKTGEKLIVSRNYIPKLKQKLSYQEESL